MPQRPRASWRAALACAVALATAAGCAATPGLPARDDASPLVVAAPGFGGVSAIARLGGDRRLLDVAPWQAADIDHLILALHLGDAATPLVTKRIAGAGRGKTIRLDGLQRDTSYRVVLTAYADADQATRLDDGEADAAACTTAFSTTGADTADAGTLALKLRDRADGVGGGAGGDTATSGSLLDIVAGGQTGSGTEGLSLVGFQVVGTLVGDGSFPTATGPLATARFQTPSSVAVDADGGIYVADITTRQIYYVDPAHTSVSRFAGLGQVGADADGSLAEANFASSPGFTGMVLADEALYVMQGTKIRKIAPLDATGRVETLTLSRAIAGGNPRRGPDGCLYVPSSSLHCIFKIDPVTGVVTVVAGVEAATGGFQDGPAASAKFNNPAAVAFDPAGRMYVADTINIRIRVVEDGVVSTLAGNVMGGIVDGTGAAAGFAGPRDVAFIAGRLYVFDATISTASRLRAVTSAGVVTTVAGSAPGFVDADSDPLKARFGSVTTISDHPDGYMVLCDQLNRRIRRYYY